uniref:NADH-ubiquinone oxidoreductase chain 2 n=1 Tax=Sphyraena pinguis TaxID=392540 RepID=A0A7D5K0U3_9TELE|nr:NADH dehydrogenase subunit 2 [Sphyraena pinguis]QLF67961.1 NADH dehydrogenase subunit 2 [Sphyraena pinguis]
MSPPLIAVFGSSLILSTVLIFAGSHWFMAWAALELNTLAVLPLMARHHHPRAVEATTKYYLVQATAASLLLFAALTNAWYEGHWNIQQLAHPVSLTLATIALAIKLGLAPFHSWMPEVLQGLDLTMGMIISTFQKIAPFVLLIQIYQPNPDLLVTLGILSLFIGGWGGLNQTQLRKILAYSSITHLGWMTLIAGYSNYLALVSFLTYIAMSTSLFLTLKANDTKTINVLAVYWTVNPMLATAAPLALMSLAGIPPLWGFVPKWLILAHLTECSMALLATLAALSSLLSLFFYLRVMYAMSMSMNCFNIPAYAPWRFLRVQLSLPLAISTVLTIALLPLTPAVISLACF